MPESSLFLAAFLSGTVLPGSSEAVLLYWLAQGEPYWQLVLIATIGNSLGGVSGYLLGRLGSYAQIEKYAGVSKEKAERYKDRARKWGGFCAFFAFLPFVGDVLTVALGLIKARAGLVIPLLTLGKLLRYIVVASFHEEVEQISRAIFDFLT